MSGFFCNFVTAKNKKHHFRRGTAVTEQTRLMTKNNFFYTEQICHYLNLLANDTIFTIESQPFLSMEEDLQVTITCKNSAYRNELNLLTMLLDSRTFFCDDRKTSVEIR